jgi:hypothetical protein
LRTGMAAWAGSLIPVKEARTNILIM